MVVLEAGMSAPVNGFCYVQPGKNSGMHTWYEPFEIWLSPQLAYLLHMISPLAPDLNTLMQCCA